MQLRKLLFGLLLVPSLGICGSLTLGGSGSGELIINATPNAFSVYPASSTASFPFGLTASTVTVSSNTILPGATFYQNGPIALGTPGFAVTLSSNAVFPNTTFYQNSYELRSSSIVFSPSTIGIFGTQTNDSALGGYVGESTVTVVTSAANFPTTTQFGDLTSLKLGAGDWDISFCVDQVANGATVTEFRAAVTSTSGNSTSGMFAGDNLVSVSPAINGVRESTACMPSFRVSLSVATQYYLKFESSFSVATPQATGRMSARRAR